MRAVQFLYVQSQLPISSPVPALNHRRAGLMYVSVVGETELSGGVASVTSWESTLSTVEDDEDDESEAIDAVGDRSE
jgi:hypothetical protein